MSNNATFEYVVVGSGAGGGTVAGSVQNLSHFRFWLSGARPWLTR